MPEGRHPHLDAEVDLLAGRVLAGTGEAPKALDTFERACRSFTRLQVPAFACDALCEKAETYLRLEDRRSARSTLDVLAQRLKKWPQKEQPPGIRIRAVLLTAQLLFREKAGKRALRGILYELSEALALVREHGMIARAGHVLLALAAVNHLLGDRAGAREHLEEARQTFQSFWETLPEAARAQAETSPEAHLLAELAESVAERGRSRRAARRSRSPRLLEKDLQSLEAREEFHGIVGRSTPMQGVFRLIERVGPTDLSVLITGESGTGKELVARAIHALSQRPRATFVAENCAAIPEPLAESELFGHAKGAFTGADRDRQGRIAAADGGTLFLDEIGDLPPSLQVKFLRVLCDGQLRPLGHEKSRRVSFRLLCATSRDLREDMRRGIFRPDLFYRLLGIEIRLPPLRERRDDIPLLLNHFFRRHSPPDRPTPTLSAGAKEALLNYAWPGNVRELESEAHRLSLLGNQCIGEDDLSLGVRGERDSDLLAAGAVNRYTLEQAKAQLEREYLKQVLRECGGNVSRVARLIGVHRASVYKKLKRLGIQR
jgi:transcriptional regulator with GAF, ATPase, and Fis domain